MISLPSPSPLGLFVPLRIALLGVTRKSTLGNVHTQLHNMLIHCWYSSCPNLFAIKLTTWLVLLFLLLVIFSETKNRTKLPMWSQARRKIFFSKKKRPGTEETHNNGSQVLIFLPAWAFCCRKRSGEKKKHRKTENWTESTGRRTTRSSARTELSGSRAICVIYQLREKRNGRENGTFLSFADRLPACVGEFQRIFVSSFIIFLLLCALLRFHHH